MDQLSNPMAVLESPNVVCECGCKTFIEVNVLKKLSALVSPTGRPEIINIPVFQCSKCGKVPDEYMNSANAKKIFGESDSKTEDKPKIEL